MVGIYVRVSTAEQETENQLPVLEEWCRGRGLKWKVFSENVSGGSLKGRVELEKLMKQVDSGYLDTVLVWDVSRFSRSVAYLIVTGKHFPL